MSTEIQFSIDGLEAQADSQVRIWGRCASGPICVGDRFDRVVEVILRETPEECVVVGTKHVADIAMRVVHIRAYEHELDALDQGMTAEIYLAGSGGESLVVGYSVAGESSTDRHRR